MVAESVLSRGAGETRHELKLVQKGLPEIRGEGGSAGVGLEVEATGFGNGLDVGGKKCGL